MTTRSSTRSTSVRSRSTSSSSTTSTTTTNNTNNTVDASKTELLRTTSNTALNAVEQQTQLAQCEGTLTNAVMKGDFDLFFELLNSKNDPNETLKERDPVGATSLHWACLMNHQPGSLSIAHEIIARYPERCSDMYTGTIYEGENCLHISIVNQNITLTKALVQAFPDSMHQHATGTFFAPGKPCYYGELPLSFAASTNQLEMVTYLLEQGADMTNQDTANGNNCLHMAVLCNNITMFDALSTHWEKTKHRYSNRYFDSTFDCGFAGSHLVTFDQALHTKYSEIPLWQHLNLKGQSCLTLAAAVGSKQMFQHILDQTRKVQWIYGPVTCVCYPLAGLDTPMDALRLRHQMRERNRNRNRQSPKKNMQYRNGGGGGDGNDDDDDSDQDDEEDLLGTYTLKTNSSPAAAAVNHLSIDRYDSTESHLQFMRIKKKLLQTTLEKSAILEIVDHNRLDLIRLKRIDDLVWRKWDAFAYRIYLKRLMHTLLFIATLFLATTLPRWDKADWTTTTSPGEEGSLDTVGYNYSYASLVAMVTEENRLKLGRSFLELSLLVVTFNKAQVEYNEIDEKGCVYHFTQSGASVFENISSALCIFVIGCVCISRATDGAYLISTVNEDAALAVATLTAWVNLLWFLLGWRATGPFVIMLQKMVVSDMRTFCLISAVFVGAFASSFNLLHTNAISNTKDGDVYSSFTHNGVLSRVEELICAMLGNFELSEYRSNSTHPQLSVCFILIYVILLSVILVNMLVAKMGDTYAKISDEAEARWRLELARMVLSMERSMTEEERRIGENMYWITLDKKRYLQVEEEEEDFWIKAATKRKKGKEGEGGENTYDPITT